MSLTDSSTPQEMDFLDSSFFATGRELPSPSEVIARSDVKIRPHPQPAPVKFDNLGLLVKFGPHVYVEEALCLRFIHKDLSGKVPVPEVYGWRVEKGKVFIYMELIRGETLLDRWDLLCDSDRELICHQLRGIVSSPRKLNRTRRTRL